MTNFVSTAVMVVALTLSASMASATTGAQLENNCNSWIMDVSQGGSVGAGKTYENSTEFQRATYCQGFVFGYAVGINHTMGTDDKGVMGTYTRADRISWYIDQLESSSSGWRYGHSGD